MGYNNYNNGNSNGYANRGNNGYNSGFNNRGFSGGNNAAPRKHSGAKYHATTKSGKPCITAWNYSKKSGLISVFIAPYSNTSTHPSKSGNEYENWMCTIEGKNVAPQHFPVLVNARTHKATIGAGFGWVVNPQAPNGGYCGSFSKKR